MSPKIVQERAGHKSMMTTMDVYSRVLPSMADAAVDVFEEALRAN